MNRNPIVAVIAIGLAIYGVYIASYLPGLMIGQPSALLLIGFFAQALVAIVAAVGVWNRSAWAPVATIVLGAAIAFTSLAEAFVLGIVSYDHALAVALVAILVTIAIAAYIRQPRARKVM
jgi:hypothetical protein